MIPSSNMESSSIIGIILDVSIVADETPQDNPTPKAQNNTLNVLPSDWPYELQRVNAGDPPEVFP